ncbi:MAG: murein hydrolase activator EnvC family protein [Solirubrobacteraceae bacterium]
MPARLRVLLVGMAIPLALWLAFPLLSDAGLSERARSLERQIERKQRQVERKRGREGRLQGQISRYGRTIGRLQGRITGLQARETTLQTDLDAKLAELAKIQESLRQERARLVRLRTRLATGRRTLSARMVELYKAGQPDVVTVILESNGFADLLERSEFLGRVSRQDRRIIERVIADKEETNRTTKRLAGLEARQTEVAGQILGRRNEVASVREQVTSQRDNFADARGERRELLSDTRSSRRQAQDALGSLEAENTKVTARIQALTGGGSGGTAGPIRRGSGALIWPINGSISSPFGMRWGRLHAGIDIPAPVGTPIRAADSGKVILAGSQGGYGNYTCIQHSGSMSTCYAHQSSIGVSVGQSVRQGQVIGATGNTGNSTGPHLHFEVRINGTPVDPVGYL